MSLTDATALPVAAAALALLAIVLGVAALVSHRRTVRRLLGVLARKDMPAALAQVAAGIEPLAERLAVLERSQRSFQEREPHRVSAPGLVHFQAYGNDGPPLSFSVVLLDGRRDGVILTSLYGRDQVRLYAKPIHAGLSAVELAAEEAAALTLALDGGGHRVLGAEAVPAPKTGRPPLAHPGGLPR